MKNLLERIAVLVVFLLLITLGLFIGDSDAANTTSTADGVIHIVPDGTTDWIASTDASVGKIKVLSVQFNPSAANDRIKIRAGGLTGTIIFDSNPVAGTAPWKDAVNDYNPPPHALFIEADDLVLDTAANASIIIRYKR